jgi:arylsulfatase A-like enzyme
MPRTVTRREFVSAALAGSAIAAAAGSPRGQPGVPSRASRLGCHTACGAKAPTLSQSQTRHPNILFILADDLGYGDLSCYGRPDYKTPNLDRLAAQGVRFVNAYSASPLCTPTRCAFITGRYPARTRVGLEEPLHERRALGDKTLTLGLPPAHPTIASLLKQSGYETALIGKWHLGYLPNFGPIQSGFEEFFGIMSGAVDFFTHKDMEGDADLFEGKVSVERIGYITEMLTQRAVEYLARRAVKNVGPRNRTGHETGKRTGRPFYLSLHYTAPHWPWEGPGDRKPEPELRGPEAFRSGGSLKTYASMMKSLDDGIGEVLRAVAQADLERHTLVIFTSDNGGERFSYNWPFMGQKNSLWEGGIRVPAIVRWPGVIKSEPGAVATGSIYTLISENMKRSSLPSAPTLAALPPGGRIVEQPTITMDWTATILTAAHTKPDPNYPLDGLDLLPIIRGSRPLTPDSRPPTPSSGRTFFWRNSNQDAALKGRWKYLNDGSREYLFNLSIDQREQANFRDENPAMFNQLRSEFKNWESTVLPRPPARSS